MIYLILIVGIIITIYGFILNNKEDSLNFDDVLNNQELSDIQYEKPLNNEIDFDDDFNKIENKLDYVINLLESKQSNNEEKLAKEETKEDNDTKSLSDDTIKLIKKINSLKENNYTLDDISKELDLGKGEVLFLQGLEKKLTN